MTAANAARTALLFIVASPAFAILSAGGVLFFERQHALSNIHRHGITCMALVDPSAPAPGQLNGVDHATHLSLMQADPSAVAFMRSHPMVSITVVDAATYRPCFGQTNSNNQPGTDAVFLNGELLPSPALRAVAIAHELVHVEHSYPETPQGRHSFIRHLWISEEGEAHQAGLRAVHRLHIPSPDSPLATYIIDIYPIPFSLALWLLFVYIVRSPFLRGTESIVTYRESAEVVVTMRK